MGFAAVVTVVVTLLTNPGTLLSFILLIFLIVAVVMVIIDPFPILCRYYAWRNGMPRPNCHIMRLKYMINVAPDVKLETVHYFPSNANLNHMQFPTLLARSPYGISGLHGVVGFFLQVQAYYMATLGYHVLLQNTRARFCSTGTWDVLVNEEFDGKKTLQWLNLQPWFNGKLGCFGAAYGGFTQFALFGNDTPIRPLAVVPAVSQPSFYRSMFYNGAADLSAMFLWHISMNAQKKDPRFFQAYISFFKSSFMKARYVYEMSLHVPLIEADVAYLGREIPEYREMLTKTDENDEFWKKRDLSALVEQADGNSFHIMTGWYDICVVQSMKMYSNFVAKGAQPYLTVFNQDHGGEGFQYNWAHIIPWYEHKLKGKEGREHPVHVEVGPGSGEWLYLDHWPPFRTEMCFYLHAEGRMGYTTPETDTIYQYTYDPTRPTPYVAGNTMKNGGSINNLPYMLVRQTEYKDIVVFTSPPMYATTIITGNVVATLYVSSSLEHTDFVVRLLDYDHKKNASMNICDGFLRIKPETQPAKDESGVFQVTIELSPTAYKIAQDHSIMLQVASGAHPFRSRNPGTGEPIHTAIKFLKAEQKIFASPSRPSFICVPTLLS